jgi:hypothetical protein
MSLFMNSSTSYTVSIMPNFSIFNKRKCQLGKSGREPGKVVGVSFSG